MGIHAHITISRRTKLPWKSDLAYYCSKHTSREEALQV
jgi:hypothetical protein